MLPKIFVVLTLLVIIGSLASGLIYMIKDDGKSTRTAKALTIRIGLSVFLFLMLMLGIYTGAIKPHGIYPAPPSVASDATPAPGNN